MTADEWYGRYKPRCDKLPFPLRSRAYVLAGTVYGLQCAANVERRRGNAVGADDYDRVADEHQHQLDADLTEWEALL
jgi:hypothetical protein